MPSAKMSKQEAKRIAQKSGISFTVSYGTLRSSQTDLLVELAKKTGYRKPASASGSRARYFFYHLAKK